MTAILVELPDEQATALRAKLSAQGMSVEQWFQKIASEELQTRSPKEAVAIILDLQKSVKPDPEGWSVKDYINHGRA